MNLRVYLLSIGCLATLTMVAAGDFDDSEIRHVAYPEWFADSFYDLEGTVADARGNDKQGLMMLFTTEGCSYCDEFIRNSLGDPGLAALVQQHFDAIGLEIFDDNDLTDPNGTVMATKQYAKRIGAHFAPTLVFLDSEGESLLKLVGYQPPDRFRLALEFLVGGHYRNTTLREFARRLASKPVGHTPKKPLRDDPLFARPPYMLDRSRMAARIPLLVLFESGDCRECEQFHDEVLANSEIRQKLADFEVVRLDADDNKTPLLMPDGRRGTPDAWFSQAGLTRTPAMLFFDEKGNEVLRTDALVLQQRMLNSANYVLEKAYLKGWTYQRFARTKSLERLGPRER